MKKLTIDHRMRVTRMLIRKAFTDLLSRKPIQSISIKELCELAGINRGTFYAHYHDIYDLMNQMQTEMLDDFQNALAPLLSDRSKASRPTDITTEIFQCIKDNSDLCTVTLGPYGDKQFLLRLTNIGRDVCLESYSRYFEKASPSKLEYYYAFASAGCIGLLQKWLDNGMTAPASEIAEAAEAIMLHGISFLNDMENL